MAKTEDNYIGVIPEGLYNSIKRGDLPVPSKENKSDLENNILTQLNDNETLSIYLKPNKKEKVSYSIVHALLEACEDLNIPIPNIEVGTKLGFKGMTFRADRYTITIGEELIRDISKRNTFSVELRFFIFHECYHAYHNIKMPKYNAIRASKIRQVRLKYPNLLNDYTEATRAELAAEIYALKQIESTQTKSALEFLEKIKMLFELKNSIRKKKNLRRKYKF